MAFRTSLPMEGRTRSKDRPKTVSNLLSQRLLQQTIVIASECTVNRAEMLDVRPRHDSERQRDLLEILRASRRADVSWLDSDIVQDSSLQPWDEEVRSFADCLVFYTCKSVEPGQRSHQYEEAVTTTDAAYATYMTALWPPGTS